MTYELTNYIIHRIKELPNQKNLTQEEFFIYSELDTKYINKLENGHFSFCFETLSKIKDILNIDYFEFSKTQHSKTMNELVSHLTTFTDDEQENNS